MTRFTDDDLERANEAWGCNCGPGSVAAILDLTLDEVRPLFTAAGFEAKRYTNPTMMLDVLRASGRDWSSLDLRMLGARQWPRWGLCRVQWEGPWTKPGVPMRARYRYTHWIGAAVRDGEVGVFDINAMRTTKVGNGWIAVEDWEEAIVPWLLEGIKRATGGWHITHAIEVERP